MKTIKIAPPKSSFKKGRYLLGSIALVSIMATYVALMIGAPSSDATDELVTTKEASKSMWVESEGGFIYTAQGESTESSTQSSAESKTYRVAYGEPSLENGENGLYSVNVSRNDIESLPDGIIPLKKRRGSTNVIDLSEGAPIVPVDNINLLIPEGKEVAGIVIRPAPAISLLGEYTLEHSGEVALDYPAKSAVKSVDADMSIYGSDNLFPKMPVGGVKVVTQHGYSIESLNLYPVDYSPKERIVSYHPYIDVELKLRDKVSTETAGQIVSPRTKLAKRQKQVCGSIDNCIEMPELADATESVKEGAVDYVIITDESLVSAFEALKDSKIKKGLSAKIVTTQEILSKSSETDLQNGIRAFIADSYANQGTEWVLLGGNSTLIPERKVSVADAGVLDHVPSDLHYAGLDGAGLDGADVDLAAEVFVGRAPVASVEEATNFVNKTLKFEQNLNANLEESVAFGKGSDIVEPLVASANGAIAAIVNPRFGWHKSYDSVSEILKANGLESMQLGEVLQASKNRNFYCVDCVEASGDSAIRCLQNFDTILIGDPEVSVKGVTVNRNGLAKSKTKEGLKGTVQTYTLAVEIVGTVTKSTTGNEAFGNLTIGETVGHGSVVTGTDGKYVLTTECPTQDDTTVACNADVLFNLLPQDPNYAYVMNAVPAPAATCVPTLTDDATSPLNGKIRSGATAVNPAIITCTINITAIPKTFSITGTIAPDFAIYNKANERKSGFLVTPVNLAGDLCLASGVATATTDYNGAYTIAGMPTYTGISVVGTNPFFNANYFNANTVPGLSTTSDLCVALKVTKTGYNDSYIKIDTDAVSTENGVSGSAGAVAQNQHANTMVNRSCDGTANTYHCSLTVAALDTDIPAYLSKRPHILKPSITITTETSGGVALGHVAFKDVLSNNYDVISPASTQGETATLGDDLLTVGKKDLSAASFENDGSATYVSTADGVVGRYEFPARNDQTGKRCTIAAGDFDTRGKNCGIHYGAPYTLTPQKIGWSFITPTVSDTMGDEDVALKLIADEKLYNITGVVTTTTTDDGPGVPVSGATVTGCDATATTGNDGKYTLKDIPFNKVCDIQVAHSSYVSGSFHPVQNITAGCNGGHATGAYGSLNTTAADDGDYPIADTTPGQASGYFEGGSNPISHMLGINETNVTNDGCLVKDFTGVLITHELRVRFLRRIDNESVGLGSTTAPAATAANPAGAYTSENRSYAEIKDEDLGDILDKADGVNTMYCGKVDASHPAPLVAANGGSTCTIWVTPGTHYQVAPNKEGYTFSPSSVTGTMGIQDVVTDIIVYPSKSSISGTVRAFGGLPFGGQPVANARVEIVNRSNNKEGCHLTASATSTTASSKYYAYTNKLGQYTLKNIFSDEKCTLKVYYNGNTYYTPLKWQDKFSLCTSGVCAQTFPASYVAGVTGITYGTADSCPWGSASTANRTKSCLVSRINDIVFTNGQDIIHQDMYIKVPRHNLKIIVSAGSSKKGKASWAGSPSGVLFENVLEMRNLDQANSYNARSTSDVITATRDRNSNAWSWQNDGDEDDIRSTDSNNQSTYTLYDINPGAEYKLTPKRNGCKFNVPKKGYISGKMSTSKKPTTKTIQLKATCAK